MLVNTKPQKEKKERTPSTDTIVAFRCNSEELNEWRKKANKENRTLSNFIKTLLNNLNN